MKAPLLKIIILIGIILGIVIFIGKPVFDRAPDRVIPVAKIVSPAMGKIIDIQTTTDSHISFFKDGLRNNLELNNITLPAHIILIEMNLQDVHVQRSPVAGTVISQIHYEGDFKNALVDTHKFDLVNFNEKTATIIESDSPKKERLAVIQVAGIVARRIISLTSPYSHLNQGSILGRITFGSQTVLVIPAHYSLNVKIGDKVVDGETIIAE